MNIRIQYGRGKVIKRYARNRVTIKMISALPDGTPIFALCSCGNCYSGDGEIHSGIPLYYYGVRHRLARHVTKLLCHRNIDNMDEQKSTCRVTRIM